MANKKKVEVDVQIDLDVEPSLKQLRELKKQLKETAAGSAEFKKLSAQIDDLEDKLKGAKVGAQDWVDSLAGASGPMGMVGRGINSMKVAFSSFNTALKASVIGLIVTTLAALVAAFAENESAMKKLQPLFIGLQKILNGLFRAFEPILDAFMEMVDVVLPPLIKGIGAYYSVLYGLFTLVKEVGVGVGKTLKGIFTFDWDSITEGVKQMAGSVSTAIGETQDAYARFDAGTKETTKIEKEQAAERQKNAEEAAKKAEELRKQQLEKQKADLDAKIKLETDSETTSRDRLKTLLDERMNIELDNKELTEAQKEVIRQEYAKKLEEALKADAEKEKKRREADLDAKIQLEVDKENTSQQKLKELLDQRMQEELSNTELTESQKEVIRKKYAKQLEDAIKSDAEKRKKDRQDELVLQLSQVSNDLDGQLELYKQFQQEVLGSEQYTAGEKLRIVQETNQKILELQRSRFEQEKLDNQVELLTNQENIFQNLRDEKQRLDDELQYYKELRDQKKITDVQFKQFYAQNVQAQIAIDKQALDEKTRIYEATSNLLSGIASLVGEQTKAGKALAIASATIDTYAAANKVLADPTPMPTFLRFALAAGAIVRGLVSVKKIVETKLPVSGGGSTGAPGGSPANTPRPPITVTAQRMAVGGLVRGPGTSTSDSIPALLSDGEFVVNARSTQLFRPLLSAINATAGMPQFAAGGLVQSPMKKDPDNTQKIAQAVEQAFGTTPIRTYVTAADISNQQQFDRVIKSRSLI